MAVKNSWGEPQARKHAAVELKILLSSLRFLMGLDNTALGQMTSLFQAFPCRIASLPISTFSHSVHPSTPTSYTLGQSFPSPSLIATSTFKSLSCDNTHNLYFQTPCIITFYFLTPHVYKPHLLN